MELQVLLFASLRDLHGDSSLSLSFDAPPTPGELLRAAAIAVPALAPHLSTVRVAVNQEFAADAMSIPDGAEVALIPPVSGG